MNQSEKKSTLLIIILINLSGWTSLSIFGPLALEIAHGLSVRISIIGIIHSFSLIFSGIMSFLWASLEKRYPRKLLLLGAMFLMSFGLLLSSLSINFIIFLICRMMMAVGFGAILPLSNSIITDIKSVEHRTKSLALLGMCLIIGFGTGNIIAGILISITSWRMILLILGLLSIVIVGFIPAMYIPSKGKYSLLNEDSSLYSFHLNRTEISQLHKIKSNIHFLIFFFIHDFVVGAISFYMIPMLKSDLHLIPIRALIFNIVMYLPQLFGAPYWGKVADKRFREKSNGKISTLLLIVIMGPIFSIIGYSLFSYNLLIFLLCIMIFAFITPSTTSIVYSILGDINPPELRSTLFSLSNFCSICGRSIGIAVCGVLYDLYFNYYGVIFLILQFVFLFGLLLTLITPLRIIPNEIHSLTILLEQRIYDSAKDEKEPRPTVKGILNTLIESQIELFKRHQKLAQNQIYLTKLLKYSLEVMRRVLILHERNYAPDHDIPKYSTSLGQKLDNYFKIIEDIKEV